MADEIITRAARARLEDQEAVLHRQIRDLELALKHALAIAEAERQRAAAAQDGEKRAYRSLAAAGVRRAPATKAEE